MKFISFIVLLLILINETISQCDEREIVTFQSERGKELRKLDPTLPNPYLPLQYISFGCYNENHRFANQNKQDRITISCLPIINKYVWKFQTHDRESDESAINILAYKDLNDVTEDMISCKGKNYINPNFKRKR